MDARIKLIQTLLAEKNYADERFRKALKRCATYTEEVDIKEHSNTFNERMVAIVSKGTQTTRLIKYAEAIKEANRKLLAEAPDYFEENSNFFKEPTVIHDITSINLTIDTSIASHKILGQTVAGRLDKFIRRKTRELLSETEKAAKKKIEAQITQAQKEKQFFTEHAETVFRTRGRPLSDIIALVKQYPHNDLKAQKVHVNAGGLIAIRHKTCNAADVKVTRPRRTSSIYNDANGFTSVLYPHATLYFEDELETLRANRYHTKLAKGLI